MAQGRRKKPRWSGRWEVQRERCRIADRTPPVEAREPAAVGDLVAGLMKRLGLDAEHWSSRIQGEWPAIVGDAVAAHTRPGRVDAGTLTVFVDHPVWMSELKRYGSREMLDNLRARYGRDQVRNIVFRIDPDA